MLIKMIAFLTLVSFPAEKINIQKKEFEISAIRIQNQPIIDGILDEDRWKTAPCASGFFQYEPDRGKLASVETIVKVLYDDKFIYFGFMCFDPEPEKIVLGTNRRDGLTAASGTDCVSVIVDTFHDRRTGYYFRTNPSGVQHDGRVADNGLIADITWDGNWKSAGTVIEKRWSAEMAIPFNTIKYIPGQNRTWGIQFSRYLPRNLEKSFWVGPLEEDYRKLSTYGKLTGLNLCKSKSRMELIPQMISSNQEGMKSHFSGGLDANYNFSQFLSGHLTINPDFATVEADRERVNLTRFELHIPEKRNFFLEGNSMYQQKIRLFYSRRIADIHGGIKFYGKSGIYEYSCLSVQTKSEENSSSANFAIFRLKRDILSSSTFGILVANKFSTNKNQGSYGLDTSFDLTKNSKLIGQLAGTYGNAKRNDLALFIGPSFDTTDFHFHIYYTYLGMYFGDNANALGFIKDDNRHDFDSSIKKNFWLNNYGIDRIEYNSHYNIYWGTDKILRSWDISQGVTIDFRNKFSIKFDHNQGYKLYEKKFRNHNSTLELGYNLREWQSAFISYQWGRNFNSDFILIGGQIKRNITQSLSLEYNFSKLSLMPDPDKKNTWVHIFSSNQYFTRDLFLKLFYQTNSALNKKNFQAIVVYRFKPPFGLIQLAYNKGSLIFGDVGSQDHTLFLKLAYVF